MKRYRTLGEYLKEKYGEKAAKICIDGSFTCPNRDGRAGVGGCIFCGSRGSGDFTAGELLRGGRTETAASVSDQVRAFLEHPETHPGVRKFIAYFQSFSNTYAPVSVLRERYDAALADEKVAVLAVGTRPDCIDGEIAALLASYKERCDVWVELGLQTSSDATARLINRGYETARFTEAVRLLRRYGLEVVAHMIIGLPDETEEDVRDTVAFLNGHDLMGVKLHSLYVTEGTRLAELYMSGAYSPLTETEYVRRAADAIARLDPAFVIHRITGDCSRELLVAPEWNVHKIRVVRQIDALLEKNGWHQGCLY